MNEDKIIEKLLEHDQEFVIIGKKIDDGFNGTNDILEQVVTIVKKIEEDHTFSVEWLKRLQDQVERQDREIIRIKQELKLA